MKQPIELPAPPLVLPFCNIAHETPFQQAKRLHEATEHATARVIFASRWGDCEGRKDALSDRDSISRERNRVMLCDQQKIAAANNWKIADPGFESLGLKQRNNDKRHHFLPLDISLVFFANRFDIPAAVLVSTFWPWHDCVEFARINDIRVEQIEYPWGYPGKTTAVIYTRCRIPVAPR